MSDAIALVILLTAAEISAPTATALERAARDVLGSDSTIRLVNESAPLTDAAALERAGHADGVVELSWHDAERTADLHCYIARESRWLDRTITFDRDDAEAERGRLLGFAIASMLAEENRPSATNERVVPLANAIPDTQRGAERVETPQAPRLPPARWLEVGGSATTGIEGSANALGVSLGLRLRLPSSFRLALGAGGLFGQVNDAQATYRAVTGNAGFVFQPIEAKAAGDFGFGVRLDGFAGWLEVSHLSEDDPAPDRQSRFVGGARGFLEGSIGVSESACGYAALGPVMSAGRTDLYTHGELAATIPVVWLMAEIGVRTAF